MPKDTATIMVHLLGAEAAHSQMEEAKSKRDSEIRKCAAAGGSLRLIAGALDLSHQRIAQIVRNMPTTTTHYLQDINSDAFPKTGDR